MDPRRYELATIAAALRLRSIRALGLTDAEIFDVIAAATPDRRFGALEPTTLRDALTVGRPIAGS